MINFSTAKRRKRDKKPPARNHKTFVFVIEHDDEQRKRVLTDVNSSVKIKHPWPPFVFLSLWTLTFINRSKIYVKCFFNKKIKSFIKRNKNNIDNKFSYHFWDFHPMLLILWVHSECSEASSCAIRRPLGWNNRGAAWENFFTVILAQWLLVAFICTSELGKSFS